MDFFTAHKFAKKLSRAIKGDNVIVGSVGRYAEKLRKGFSESDLPKKIKDIDLLVIVPKEESLGIVNLPKNAKIKISGKRKISFTLNKVKVDIFFALKSEKPFALLHYLNSKYGNISLRKELKKDGFKLNQYGLFKGVQKLDTKQALNIIKQYR